MKYVYLTLNWVFGVLFLLAGVIVAIATPLGGLSLVGVSLLLLPPVRKIAHSKTNKEIPMNIRAFSIIVLFIAFGIFVVQSQDKKTQEITVQQAKEKAAKVAQIKQSNINHFTANKKQIISSANAALSEKEYQSVISQTNKYLVSGDIELKKINSTAKNELAEINKAEKTKQLLTKLKGVPSSEYEKNKNLYQQLVKLHSNNKLYKNKVATYSGKIKKEKQRKLAVEIRKKQIEKQFSAWDGSHRNLERIIKKEMNDPDSYEHDKTTYWDKGDHLIVKTIYRGKNAFGGIVRNHVIAKIDLEGQILQIID